LLTGKTFDIDVRSSRKFGNGYYLECLRGAKSRRPGPLEIEAAQLPGYIH
jgi:hypothetical protein